MDRVGRGRRLSQGKDLFTYVGTTRGQEIIRVVVVIVVAEVNQVSFPYFA